MKKQGAREQGREGAENRVQGPRDPGTKGTEDMKQLLREAVAPVGEDAGLQRDLWLEMQQRLRAESVGPAERAALRRAHWRAMLVSVSWFDWVLAGGLAVFAIVAPVSIPVLLYYL